MLNIEDLAVPDADSLGVPDIGKLMEGPSNSDGDSRSRSRALPTSDARLLTKLGREKA
jgi:hypothetical protein